MRESKDEIPVSKRYLDLRIQEVNENVITLRLETRAGFSGLDSKFADVEKRFSQIDARFAQPDVQFAHIDERFSQMDTRFVKIDERLSQIDEWFSKIDVQLQDIKTQLTKMMVIIEEQNDRNRVVMDGFMTIYEKLQETNHRVDRLEKQAFGI